MKLTGSSSDCMGFLPSKTPVRCSELLAPLKEEIKHQDEHVKSFIVNILSPSCLALENFIHLEFEKKKEGD